MFHKGKAYWQEDKATILSLGEQWELWSSAAVGAEAEDCFHMLKKNVAYIQSLGAIPILGLPPHIDFDPDGDNAVVKAYGELILAYAKEQGLVVINFYDALLAADARKEIIFAGDVHPNTLGYRYMYETAWPIIDKQIKAYISYKDRT